MPSGRTSAQALASVENGLSQAAAALRQASQAGGQAGGSAGEGA